MSVKDIPTIDKEVIELCDAMNRFKGVTTFESCCGHGDYPFRVWFVVDSLESLPPLLYFFDGCHSGIYGWTVKVTTDCAMSPVHFCACSKLMGEGAYYESTEIARYLNQYIDELEKENASNN